MLTFEDVENGRSLRPVDSNITLFDTSRESSGQSTPYQSRNTSRERLRKDPMRVVNESARTTHRYLSHELDPSWMGTVLVICFFTSGLVDSVAFNTWNCFVGMQTGNTVFAALGLGGQPQATHRQQYYKSLVSISSFCLGTLFFNALHRYPTGLSNPHTSRRRWIFVVSFIIQTLFIITAAIMVTLDLVSHRAFKPGTFSSGTNSSDLNSSKPNFIDLVPIVFLSFESAGQVCLSRVLGVVELPTIVLSTLYHDFTADIYGIREAWGASSSFSDFILVQHRRQEKRLVSIVMFFVGAVVGSEMFKSKAGMGGALWMAAGLKLSIVLMFLVWKKDASEERESLPA